MHATLVARAPCVMRLVFPMPTAGIAPCHSAADIHLRYVRCKQHEKRRKIFVHVLKSTMLARATATWQVLCTSFCICYANAAL